MGASAKQTGLAGAEAPEPHSRLGPTDGIPSAKVVRDGKVAVLVSGGFGAGWYSWNDSCRELLFDPALVAAVEADDSEAIHVRAAEIYPDGYFGGSSGLVVEWVPEGAVFRIDEYDGNESLVVQADDEWIVA